MNAATTTLGAKDQMPSEGKPWNVFKRGDKWAVYKVDADGQPIGRALGKHDTEDQAIAAKCVLYTLTKAQEKRSV